MGGVHTKTERVCVTEKEWWQLDSKINETCQPSHSISAVACGNLPHLAHVTPFYIEFANIMIFKRLKYVISPCTFI